MGFNTTAIDDDSKEESSFSASAMQWAALIMSVAASLALLGWVMLLCRSGFDFSDEGYYLNWISNPWNYPSSVSQFGFVYHPLYRLVGGDIVLLRQANVLVIFALAFALCATILRSVAVVRIDVRSSLPIWGAALALVMAAGSLTFFGLWLPTPSYNSLSFTSLMGVAIGVLLTGRKRSKSVLIGWILIGAGGALSFLAKPTSAALLGCAVLIYLVVAGRFWLRGLLVCVLIAAVLLIASAMMIDGSLAKFVNRVLDGVRLGSLLTPDQPFARMFRVDSFHFGGAQRANFALLLAITFTAMFLGTRAGAAARIGVAAIAIFLTGLSMAVSTGALLPNVPYHPFQPMQFFAITFAVALSLFFASRREYRGPSRNAVALAVFFITLPYVYAFGTGNNYWEQGARAGLFWLLGGVVIGSELTAKNAAWRNLTPIAAAALLVTAGVVLAATQNPYRQTQPLRLQTSPAEIGPDNATLFLTDNAAIYIRKFRRIATDNGFKTGDPLLDLSGRNPGLVYALGGRPPGASWILAGYTGSYEFFSAALASESCDVLGAMWILTEPPASFSASLLQPYGIDISRDYQEAGSVRSVRGASRTEFEQFLLKPSRNHDVARQACERARLIGR
ncbi:hypothetical protein [Bradyrhizobium sp. CCBAU 051011]|uniref:hypothetical protein n=1 Tax=Bradyrhizobium sp. CCBAU 051011 TaxID=858422 RepID=UPI00137A9F5B|nr:hypothetical protein [Bradyrhizobium sp. CCBAU 051011]